MAHWLLKSEPSSWSWDQQVKAGAKGTFWNGVRNHSAKLNLMAMKKGEKGFFYHSNEDKAVVGIVEARDQRREHSLLLLGVWQAFPTLGDRKAAHWAQRFQINPRVGVVDREMRVARLVTQRQGGRQFADGVGHSQSEARGQHAGQAQLGIARRQQAIKLARRSPRRDQ